MTNVIYKYEENIIEHIVGIFSLDKRCHWSNGWNNYIRFHDEYEDGNNIKHNWGAIILLKVKVGTTDLQLHDKCNTYIPVSMKINVICITYFSMKCIVFIYFKF